MGKGFNNYMCKKFFHPASRDNLKRVWMAEQKAESYKKKQEELRVQYEKEQDLYTNKAILSKESKDKLSVNFMYEPPPGTKKEREREDDEPEYKFEWQRKFNAPREDYCKGDSEIRDQPFGIQVRNVRCIKCHKWGHINTDKECPMYNQASSSDQTGPSLDPLLLVQQMREDGLAMKKSALSLQQHMRFSNNQDLIPSEDEDEKSKQSEMEFLKALSVKQKRRLLRKLEKLEKKGKNNKSSKKKQKKKKKSKRKAKESESSDSSSESSDSEHDRRTHKEKKRAKKDKTKKKDKHYRNIVVKEEHDSGSSSEAESPSKALERVLGRSIDFAGPKTIKKEKHNSSSESLSDREHKHKNGKYNYLDARSYRKDFKEDGDVRLENGAKTNSTKHRDRKRSAERDESSHRKKQRQ
ncbi:Corepressor interacting with RBPJ 1 [Blattella germanica]|nr:Corepressor interacting with RBPJ 1 [Blattella germanica]